MMPEIVISQGELIGPEKSAVTDLCIEHGRVYFATGRKAVASKETKTIDAAKCFITAGLFDLQVNGIDGCDLWDDPNREQFSNLCLSMLKAGVTAFLPTLITDELQHLDKNIKLLESFGVGKELESNKDFDPINLVSLPGIHLEGPFLSPEKPGVHPQEYIRPITMEDFKRLVRPSVKLMTLAPELKNGSEAIKYLRQKNVVPSLGHSNANYAEAMEAFHSGISVVTHIFNAMPALHHRELGAVGAALLNDSVYCCVICDGLHVDPDMVRLLIKIKGKNKVILVTDIASVGTTGGGLVGSSITLSQAVSNLVKWGIAPFEDAIQMATINPAKLMQCEDIGKIEDGGKANLVIWDKQSLAIKHVVAKGQLVF